MSAEITQLEPDRPECFVSAKLYERYLWLGHCVVLSHQDFWEDEYEFHQDRAIADHATQEMLQLPEKPLIQQLGRIIKTGAREIGITRLQSMSASQRNGLQVYLASEVSTEGMRYAHEDGYISQDPYLAMVESPFKDSWLVGSTLRYQNQRTGEMSKALLNYATLGRLLPGYPPATYER